MAAKLWHHKKTVTRISTDFKAIVTKPGFGGCKTYTYYNYGIRINTDVADWLFA
jgi:hypothetical protein